ncbi:MAG: sugar phosphate isomerase/epimerase [Methanomicrobia archaeon]|nr:sugar phosphate isomerase/epimerase [Methanomicrobia archaeon]
MIGASTMIDLPLNRSIEEFRRLGLDFAEIRSDLIIEDIKSDFEFTVVHSPIYDINLASLNNLIRKASVKTLKKTIDFIYKKDINTEIFVVHAGHLTHNLGEVYLKKAWRSLRKSINELLKKGEEYSIVIGVENSQKKRDRVLIRYPEDYIRLKEEINSDFLKYVFDLGHANTWKIDLKEAIRVLGEDIVLFHLHDNNGENDSHLPLGKGSIDFSIIKNEKRPMTLEMKTLRDLKASLAYLSLLKDKAP